MTENSDILNIIDADELHEILDIEVTKEKPFNKCLTCEYLGAGCSGPNLNAMSVERACEFLQIRRGCSWAIPTRRPLTFPCFPWSLSSAS